MLVSNTTSDAEAESCVYSETRSWLVSGWVGLFFLIWCVCCPTFWSFDEFDLNDGLYHGPAAPNIQPDNRACDLQGLHRFTVRNLRHVCVVNPQNAVVYSGRQSSNSTMSMTGSNLKQNSWTQHSSSPKTVLEWLSVRKIEIGRLKRPVLKQHKG